MISLTRLNKILLFIIFFVLLNINFVYAEDKAEDIWDSENENIQEKNSETNEQKEIKIEGSTISSDVEKIIIKIDENKIEDFQQSIVGIFDPDDNNFSLNMWKNSDGEEIKKVLKRLNKLNLSKLSEELLFQVLFTNAYSPNKNLNSEDFLKIKINWLINKKRIKDLETLLKNNSQVGKSSKAVKYLINEYLSEADIKSACDKINFIDQDIKNNYLDKFIIYCLINNDRQDEAQLIFDLLKEKGFKDNFFENKINFLLGVSNETTQKVVDNDLLNFHLSQITVDNFNYEPTDKTNKYIWKYLGAANLIKLNSFQDEEIIITYEKAAAQNTFDKDEIFKIYLRIDFNFNQLLNAEEIYKTLPNYKSRALIYQSILLNDNVEKKIMKIIKVL